MKLNSLPSSIQRSITLAVYPVLAFLLFIASYYDTLKWMYGRFISPDSYYTHGFIIPIISGFMIWQKRHQFKTERIEFNWAGLIIMILSALIHIFGTILYIFSISGFSIFLFVIGASLFLFGKDNFKIMLYPLVFLAFMFPVPEAFISVISFPMKLFVAKAGAQMVSLIGIPIYREGFNITIPAGNLLVGNPCSGLRSLIAFMAIGAVLVYIIPLTRIKRVLLFLTSIPIAIVTNLFRVPMLILISHYWGLQAAAVGSFWHTFSGLLMFVCGFLVLFLIGRQIENDK